MHAFITAIFTLLCALLVNASQTAHRPESKLLTGAQIAGVVIGIVLFLVLLVVIIMFGQAVTAAKATNARKEVEVPSSA